MSERGREELTSSYNFDPLLFFVLFLLGMFYRRHLCAHWQEGKAPNLRFRVLPPHHRPIQDMCL